MVASSNSIAKAFRQKRFFMNESKNRAWSRTAFEIEAFPDTEIPIGVVTAIFVQGVWGQANDFICCFLTDNLQLKRFRLTTFARTGYAPHDGGPTMCSARPGERYHLTIGRTAEDYPAFLKARLINGSD